MGLSMVFQQCVTQFPLGVAQYKRGSWSHHYNGKGNSYKGITRLFSEQDLRDMLTQPNYNFPDNLFVTEHELLRGLAAIKAYKDLVYLPRQELHR